jgi:hypothetical protein
MDDRQRRVRERAHAIWQEEGRPEGRDREHWVRAEQELRDEGSGDPQGGTAGGEDSATPAATVETLQENYDATVPDSEQVTSEERNPIRRRIRKAATDEPVPAPSNRPPAGRNRPRQ